MHSSSQSTILHLYKYTNPLFCLMLSLSFGVARIFFIVCSSCFQHIFLKLSHSPNTYVMTIWPHSCCMLYVCCLWCLASSVWVFVLHSILGPCGVSAPQKYIMQMLLFCSQQFLCGANCFGPRCEYFNHTVFGSYVVMTVPL